MPSSFSVDCAGIDPARVFFARSRFMTYAVVVLCLCVGLIGYMAIADDAYLSITFPIIGCVPGILIAGFVYRENKIKFGYDLQRECYPPEITKALSYLRSNEGKRAFCAIALKVLACAWAIMVALSFTPYLGWEGSDGNGMNWFIIIAFSCCCLNWGVMILILDLESAAIVREWHSIQEHQPAMDIDHDVKFVLTDNDRKVISFVNMMTEPDAPSGHPVANRWLSNGLDYCIDLLWAVALMKYIMRHDKYSLATAIVLLAVAIVRYRLRRQNKDGK